MTHESSYKTDSHLLHVQQLFIRHQQALLSFVLSVEPNLADAQDIVQEVFLTVSKKADTWTAGTNFLAWICTVARYEVLSFQRKRARQVAKLDNDVIELVCMETQPDLEAFEQRVAFVRNCMDRLSPTARELILLRYHNAQMPETIAPIVGWTVNAVRVALTRARRVLRECMERRLAAEKTS
jgi:RNA polymerase sigma-70 factor (ECF subfamily)